MNTSPVSGLVFIRTCIKIVGVAERAERQKLEAQRTISVDARRVIMLYFS